LRCSNAILYHIETTGHILNIYQNASFRSFLFWLLLKMIVVWFRINVFFAPFAFLRNGFSALSKFFNTFCSTEQLKFLATEISNTFYFMLYSDIMLFCLYFKTEQKVPIKIEQSFFNPFAQLSNRSWAKKTLFRIEKNESFKKMKWFLF